MARLLLGSMVLNEMEWLERLLAQHHPWTRHEVLRWVFVEAADQAYADANPEMVSPQGLSIDGTTEFLEQAMRNNPHITHVKHGFTRHTDPAQGKCAAQNVFLEAADRYQPDFVLKIDCDEFYTRKHQGEMIEQMERHSRFSGFIFHRREIWRPPSIAHLPLLTYEVVGGFWAIPCCHWWKYHKGMRYQTNHNTPELPSGELLNRRMIRLDRSPGMLPEMVHTGFASLEKTRRSKNRYYEQRGEGTTDHRKWYTDSRAAWYAWQRGMSLPGGARVIPYKGPRPESLEESEGDREGEEGTPVSP